MAVTYTKSQREKAKREKLHLCSVDTPRLAFQGPCTAEEFGELLTFLDGFLTRRFDRLKNARLNGAQETKR